MTEWITDVIDRLGMFGVALLVALESVFPPIPSELILPFAGFVAGQGDASFIGMVSAATIGSLVGAWILYGISAVVGPERLHRFVRRFGRWFGVKTSDLTRAEEWFDRRSDYAVLFGRCVPLIRSLVSVPAGFRRMPIVKFSIATTLGSLVWNTALIGGGALLGNRWRELGEYVAVFQWLVVVAVVAAVGWFVWTRSIKPKLTGRDRDGEPVDDGGHTTDTLDARASRDRVNLPRHD